MYLKASEGNCAAKCEVMSLNAYHTWKQDVFLSIINFNLIKSKVLLRNITVFWTSSLLQVFIKAMFLDLTPIQFRKFTDRELQKVGKVGKMLKSRKKVGEIFKKQEKQENKMPKSRKVGKIPKSRKKVGEMCQKQEKQESRRVWTA